MHGEHGLIDFDLWTYDIPFAAQRGDKVFNFDYCVELFYRRLAEIKKMSGIKTWEGYLTGTNNFRHDIAVTVPYKGTRKQPKPFHYENMRTWLTAVHGVKVIDNMEADDILAIRQMELGESSCIVSRDKDLRMVPGWHFGYSCGKQKTFGPMLYDEIGLLEMEGRGDKKKIKGGGLKFFYSQLITGDRTDNILGLKGGGDVLAYTLLNDLQTEEELFQTVWKEYYRVYKEEAKEKLLENGQLLWMVRELDENGDPVMWEFPFEPEIIGEQDA